MDAYVESKLLNFYGPSEERQRKRLLIMNMVKALVKEVFLPYDVTVAEYGSFPLKTFLNESDIDLTVLLPKDYPVNAILQMIKQYLEYHPMMYELEACQLIEAEIHVLKLKIYGIALDITVNQINGLFTHSFLEQIDEILPSKNLLKRSILLLKLWAQNEARIMGSAVGLLSSYAIQVLVLQIINVYPEIRTERTTAIDVFKKVIATLAEINCFSGN